MQNNQKKIKVKDTLSKNHFLFAKILKLALSGIFEDFPFELNKIISVKGDGF